MLGNFFSNVGDKDTTALLQSIRIGRVTFVDVDNATVFVNWVDRTGGRTKIPLNMPFCEEGWGVMTMPRKNTIVVCAMRPYEFPIVIAYLPPNFMTPDSRWSDYKKISGLKAVKDTDPSLANIGKGEIILRNMIEKAKCKVCGNVYTLEEWASSFRYNNDQDKIPIEICPNPACNKPALEFTGEEITAVNKIQMGILIYMQKDGKLRIKLNDGLVASDGFTKGSIVDINFDENSNMTITGIQNLNATMENLTETISKNMQSNIDGNKTENIEGNLTNEVTGSISMKSPDVKLGDDQALSLVVAQKLITAITALLASMTTHTHVSPVGPTGPAVPPFQNTIQPTAIQTTKVKAT